ncbi:hypothetical protein [Rubrivivax gelatinosus]|nr:hypothetical protein [Rubrivivax gelatinosus]
MARHAASLVLDAGSSSLRFPFLRDDPMRAPLQPVFGGQVSGIAAVFESV